MVSRQALYHLNYSTSLWVYYLQMTLVLSMALTRIKWLVEHCPSPYGGSKLPWES
jgi:hypothetical protein